MNWLLEMLVSKYLNIDSCGKNISMSCFSERAFLIEKKNNAKTISAIFKVLFQEKNISTVML